MIILKNDGTIEPFGLKIIRESMFQLTAPTRDIKDSSDEFDGEIDFGTELKCSNWMLVGVTNEGLSAEEKTQVRRTLAEQLNIIRNNGNYLIHESDPSRRIFVYLEGRVEIEEYPSWLKVSIPFRLEPFWVSVDEKTIVIVKDTIGWQAEIEQTSYFFSGRTHASYWRAQGFKPVGALIGATVIKASVQSLGADGIAPDTHWYIYNDNDGVPGLPISDAVTIAGIDWPAFYAWATVQITLNTPLKAGKQYWLVITSTDGDGDNCVRVLYSQEDVYYDGYMAYSTDAGGLWGKNLGRDFTFKIGVPPYNAGNIDTPMVIELQGPATNPEITVDDSVLKYTGILTSSDVLTIDTEYMTVKFNGINAIKNYEGGFPDLHVGGTTFVYEGSGMLTVRWYDRWV